MTHEKMNQRRRRATAYRADVEGAALGIGRNLDDAIAILPLAQVQERTAYRQILVKSAL